LREQCTNFFARFGDRNLQEATFETNGNSQLRPSNFFGKQCERNGVHILTTQIQNFETEDRRQCVCECSRIKRAHPHEDLA
jgi:hypothetical protein